MNNLSDYKYPEFNEDFEGMVPANGGGGSGGGGSVEPLIVRLTVEGKSTTMDKTYQEIYDSLANGVPAYVLKTDVTNSVALFPITQCVAGHGYEVHVDTGSQTDIYSATTAGDYPGRGQIK